MNNNNDCRVGQLTSAGDDYGDGEDYGGVEGFGHGGDSGDGEDDDDNDVVSAKVHLADKVAVTTDSMKIGGNRNDDRQAGNPMGYYLGYSLEYFGFLLANGHCSL